MKLTKFQKLGGTCKRCNGSGLYGKDRNCFGCAGFGRVIIDETPAPLVRQSKEVKGLEVQMEYSGNLQFRYRPDGWTNPNPIYVDLDWNHRYTFQLPFRFAKNYPEAAATITRFVAAKIEEWDEAHK